MNNKTCIISDDGEIVNASELRGSPNFQTLYCRGYYKWWANKDDFLRILDKLELDFISIENDVEKQQNEKGNLYCIYLGIAAKETFKNRIIGCHINGNLKGSTLRKSLAAMFRCDEPYEATVNKWIDKFFIQWFPYPTPSLDKPSNEDYAKIHGKEREMLDKHEGHLYVLNIQKNKHSKAPVPKLKELRKAVKP